MFSVPPTTTTRASPARIARAPSTIVFMPEPHSMFTVVAVTSTGMPAPIAACRATFCPFPAASTQPRKTSSTWSGATPARLSASATTIVPSAGAEVSFRAPPKLPMAVRHAETM